MQIKIESDGTIAGTRIFDAETHAAIGLVQSITWTAKADDVWAECTIKLIKCPIDAMVDATIIEEIIGPINALDNRDTDPSQIDHNHDQTEQILPE